MTAANPAFLQGVRVIDLSQYVPGPFATRQLADLGADVIKLEPPSGDPMRSFMHPDTAGKKPSVIYQHLNRGKRVCRLDLKSDKGFDSLQRLLVGADILLESYRPGVLSKLGFSRKALQQINPSLIHCAVSGYGQDGPYSQRAGHDLNYCAASSVLAVNGNPDHPQMCYPLLADHAVAMQASISILAALYGREKQSTGAFIDLSFFETALSWQYMPILLGENQRASNPVNGGAACYNIYQCADAQFVSIGALEPHFWKRFCKVVDQPDWIDRQFEAMPQQQLIAQLSALFSRYPLPYWVQRFKNIDCCFEPVITPSQLDQHAQIRFRGSLSESGPRYPAWINRRPMTPPSACVEVACAQKLAWNAR